jgi:HK97 family phage prohead protease
MADVDNSAWDGGAAMSGCAKADNPAAAYGAICAGKKSGDPALQSSWALPHHMHPGSPPNAAGVRNALSRLPQTQGLTNKQAAQAHLEAHMKVISPPAAKAAAGGQVRQGRADALAGNRRALSGSTARLEPFTAQWRTQLVEWQGQQRQRLDGYASVTGIEYEMWDIFGPYGETIHPDAFNATLAAAPDVAFLVNHRGITMARTTNGTLSLEADPRGLHSVAHVNPDRNDVHDLVTAIDDHDVTEMSFAFQLDEGEWDDDFEHFTITKVNLDRGDVSAVNYGANPYTDIAARARTILGDLEHLPAAAQRAAFDRLAVRLGTGRTVAETAADAGCEDEVRAAAQAHADSLTPTDTTPRGRSVQFYETMLRL